MNAPRYVFDSERPQSPTPEQIRALRGDMTRTQFAELLFMHGCERTIEAWETRQNPMPPPVWEFAKIVCGHRQAIAVIKLTRTKILVLSSKIIADYLEHYDFPTQGMEHMRDCITSNLKVLR